jgi:hypothetical protein
MEPVSQLIRTVDVGARTLAMAQRLVHQGTPVLAPDGAPRCLTDGFRDALIALGTHDGRWMPPERRHGPGPLPTPRWRPWPQRLEAPVVKSYRRRRLVRGKRQVGGGGREPIASRLATRGWAITTAWIARLNPDLRPPVAASGRRVTTRGKHDAGLRQQVVRCPPSHNFVWPHASWRVPRSKATPGTGSGQRGPQRTPAMAAGLTARVWNLREVLRSRVPPGPQSPGGEGPGHGEDRHPPLAQCVNKPAGGAEENEAPPFEAC